MHKSLKLSEGGNATGVSSMLGFYGEGCAEDTKHVHCRKLNKRNFCPTSASRHMCSSAGKEDGDRYVCYVEDRYVMRSNDQAEARAKISR